MKEVRFGDERLEQRFWDKIAISSTGCWCWTAARTWDSYGIFAARADNAHGFQSRPAHRVAYEALIGAIPQGLTLDHLCRLRTCVNPDHLEPVPIGVNTLRGNTIPAAHARKTHCPQGHEYTSANTYRTPAGGRSCRSCRRSRAAIKRAKRKVGQ